MATVEVKHLTKQFDGNATAAVDDLDLATGEGEYLVLLGPSGCGKTTLLRLIAGLEQPTVGRGLHRRRAHGGPAAAGPQDRHGLPELRPLPPQDGPQQHRLPPEGSRPAAGGAGQEGRVGRRLLGITRLLDRRPRQLSGGERQRVALARALVREPNVFLLDEPLSNLDAKLRATARDDLKQFQDRVGTTTIYVTHDQVEAMGMGDRIAVMAEGRIRQLGTPVEVYDDPGRHLRGHVPRVRRR